VVKPRGEAELSSGKRDHRSLFHPYDRNGCDSAPLFCLELAREGRVMSSLIFQGASGGCEIENTRCCQASAGS